MLFVLLVTSCQLLKTTTNKAKALAQCKFELVDVHKKGSFTENTSNIWNYVITFKIAGINPTSENITLGGYKSDLYANAKWIGNIATDTNIVLKRNDTTTIFAKTIISPGGVIGILLKKLFDRPIEYKIKGTFYLTLGNFTYPIECELIKFAETPNK